MNHKRLTLAIVFYIYANGRHFSNVVNASTPLPLESLSSKHHHGDSVDCVRGLTYGLTNSPIPHLIRHKG